MKIEVTGCDDCPFNDYEWNECVAKAPSRHEHGPQLPFADEVGAKDPTPDWCPLREEPVTVEKKHECDNGAITVDERPRGVEEE